MFSKHLHLIGKRLLRHLNLDKMLLKLTDNSNQIFFKFKITFKNIIIYIFFGFLICSFCMSWSFNPIFSMCLELLTEHEQSQIPDAFKGNRFVNIKFDLNYPSRKKAKTLLTAPGNYQGQLFLSLTAALYLENIRFVSYHDEELIQSTWSSVSVTTKISIFFPNEKKTVNFKTVTCHFLFYMYNIIKYYGCYIQYGNYSDHWYILYVMYILHNYIAINHCPVELCVSIFHSFETEPSLGLYNYYTKKKIVYQLIYQYKFEVNNISFP